MDQIKIGKFIAEMRKEQNLTQVDLAEQLGISNKTISKWECGNGMPDYAVIDELCAILKINVNELLSGERLPSQDYNKKAEENIMSLMQENNEIYKNEKKEMLLVSVGISVLLLLVWWIIIMFGGVAATRNVIDVSTFVSVITMAVIILAVTGMWKDFKKAFSIVLKSNSSVDKVQIQRSSLAVKTAMLGVNVAGGLYFAIGIVTSLGTWRGDIDRLESIDVWIAVSFLCIVYGLVITLVLLPIYMRLKLDILKKE